ncbi:glycosyltransferase [Rapidithrix thailandica]|uniref:Glycosyltransferase n=1 Tax=Rapidithrix thailandica TaxID=413964 RepID=A0AAW9S2S4_9BACT
MANARKPLVSVICLCHNHGPYVRESLESVCQQTYPDIELIIVDDASTDNSPEEIERFVKQHPGTQYVALLRNLGNCRAFNRGLALASGKYVIDLAADDILLPQRVEQQVAAMEELGPSYGVVFSDAEMIDEAGNKLKTYYARNAQGELMVTVPSGRVYKELVKKAFICTPTMMIRKALLDELGGYDESLSYEDYDFWVRSGRNYLYFFQDKILTQKRVLPHSHGQSFYKEKFNRHLVSTLKVCHKAYQLNRSPEEHQALAVSVRYHMRQAFYVRQYSLVEEYLALLKKIDSLHFPDHVFLILSRCEVPVTPLYRWYLKMIRTWSFSS